MSKKIVTTSLVPRERIERAIILIRGQKVMLDADLARLYGVTTRALNQAVKRNIDRFPHDFMFRLNHEESDALSRSQFVILKRGKNIKYRPYAFTEQGVAMLSSVLRSKRAIGVNIAIMRVFSRLRQFLASHADLLRRLDAMESKYDENFRVVFEAIRQLMTETDERPKDRMGFHTEAKKAKGGERDA
jgi:ORF6N domain